MKTLKIITLFVVAAAFTACDDEWIMDLTPPYGGWLWLVHNEAILKIDPTTGERLDGFDSHHYRDYNAGLAFGDGKVWVAWVEILDDLTGEYEGFFRWIDPITKEESPKISLGRYFHVLALAWGGGYLYLTTGLHYYRIDTSQDFENDYVIEELFEYGDWYARGLAWDGTYLWTATTKAKKISRLDPVTGGLLHQIPAPCEGAVGLAWDGEALWVNAAKDNRGYRVSPKDGEVLGYLQYDFAGTPRGLAFEFPSE